MLHRGGAKSRSSETLKCPLKKHTEQREPWFKGNMPNILIRSSGTLKKASL